MAAIAPRTPQRFGSVLRMHIIGAMLLRRGFRWLIAFFACVPSAIPGQLRPATVTGWEDYIQAVESRLRSQEAKQGFWTDRVAGLTDRLRSGEIIAWPTNGKRSRSVPYGLIHDWTGAIFIPNTSIADVVAILRDYDRYAQYYAPTVRGARLISQIDDRDCIVVHYRRKALFFTVVLRIEYDVRYRSVDDHQWYSVSRSMSVQEIQNYGDPAEHPLPTDDGNGYIWRAFGITKLDRRDDGVYLEQESITLSRTIPVELRWLVEPFVDRIARELVTGSLRKTRDAVLGYRAGVSNL